jgi:hypothetical protein
MILVRPCQGGNSEPGSDGNQVWTYNQADEERTAELCGIRLE